MALKLDILANTRQMVSEMKKGGESVEDISDALDDLTRDATSSGDKTERAIDGVGDAAKDAARDVDTAAANAEQSLEQIGTAGKTAATEVESGGDKMERTFRDLVTDAKKAERAVDDIGEGSKKNFGDASGAAADFKDEAVSNISEVASSFDGSVESAGELIQGTLGGLADMTGAIPGIGIAAAGAAAGVGIITQAFVNAKEATDEARDSAFEYALTVADAGKYADVSARIDEISGSVEKMKEVQDIATISGWELHDIITALATGDGLPALTEAFDEGANSTSIASQRALELNGVLDGTAQGFALATPAAKAQSRAFYDLATKAGTATGEVDDLGNKIVKMPDGKEVVVNTVTKEAYEDLDSFEKRKLNVKRGRVQVEVDDSAWNNWRPAVKQGLVIGAVVGRMLP